MAELKIIEDDGCIYPNALKGWFFPNWFNQEHFEDFLDQRITRKDFEAYKEFVEDMGLYDEISELMRSFLCETWNDFKEWQEER